MEKKLQRWRFQATKKCMILFAPADQKRMQQWQISQSLSINKQNKLRTERADVQRCKDLAVCLSSVYRKHNGSIQPLQGLSRGFVQCLHYRNLLDVPLSFYRASQKPEKNITQILHLLPFQSIVAKDKGLRHSSAHH